MLTRLLALAAAATLVAVSLTGCVRAVGPMTSSSPDIGSDVTAVVLDTSGDLDITEGEPALTIHAPESVIGLLTADVSDGVLELARRPGAVFAGTGRIRYELTVPSLESIELNGSGDITSTVTGGDLTIEISGSGDVTVTGLAAEEVTLSLVGSGDVELAGATTSLAIELDGSGDIDAADLEAIDASVSISGSGDASITATETLTVDISGSGSVHHRGGAEVDADISGSGEVDEDD